MDVIPTDHIIMPFRHLPIIVTVADGVVIEHPPWGSVRSTKNISFGSAMLSSINLTRGHATAIPNDGEGAKFTLSVFGS